MSLKKVFGVLCWFLIALKTLGSACFLYAGFLVQQNRFILSSI